MNSYLDDKVNFDVKSLRCFMKVAENEHLTRSAQELYISQAQLSRIISDLEDQFGVRFFDRSGKGFHLNACGRAFYQYAQEGFSVFEKAMRRVREIYLHEQNQITVVCNVSNYVPGLLRQLHEDIPSLKFRQIYTTRRKALQLLKAGVADFSLTLPPLEDVEIKKTFLFKEEGIVIYPEHHWLEAQEHVSLGTLNGEPMIGQAAGYAVRDGVDQALMRHRFRPDYVVEVSDANTVMQCVKQGLGIAIGPKSVFLQDPFCRLHYAELDEVVTGNLGLSYLASRLLNETDEAFIKSAQEYFTRRSESLT